MGRQRQSHSETIIISGGLIHTQRETYTGLANRETSELLDYGCYTTLPRFAYEIIYL